MKGTLPVESYNWQTNREVLREIRALTTYLFSRFFGGAPCDVPKIPPSLAAAVLQKLKGARLIADDVNSVESLSEALTEKAPTVHQLQELHGQLMMLFVERLFNQALLLFEDPPCDYALIAFGSLARGEMGVYSDLDAVLLIKHDDSPEKKDKPKKDEKTFREKVEYFGQVTSYFELLVINLGETKVNLLDLPHLRDRFNLDVAALHPGKTIQTPKVLAARQLVGLKNLRGEGQFDPIPQALRLSHLVMGSDKLHSDYVSELRSFYAVEGRAEEAGQRLLVKWLPPEEAPLFFDAKKGLYYPLRPPAKSEFSQFL